MTGRNKLRDRKYAQEHVQSQAEHKLHFVYDGTTSWKRSTDGNANDDADDDNTDDDDDGDDADENDGNRITSVSIHPSVKEIPANTFKRCSSITSVSISDNVEAIGDYAFDSTSVVEIAVPDNVKTIGEFAFVRCKFLTSVTLGSVKVIRGNTFYDCTALADVTFSDSVEIIETLAFRGCKSLAQVRLPEGATIQPGAFEGCPCEVDVGQIASVDFLRSAPNEVLTGNSMTEIHVPEDLTSIAPEAHAWHTAITSIIVPSNVATIGENAFFKCTSLTSATLPERLITISAGAFEGCSRLTTIEIHSNVAFVGARAFSGCTSLEVTISESVTTIGPHAFEGCLLGSACRERYMKHQDANGCLSAAQLGGKPGDFKCNPDEKTWTFGHFSTGGIPQLFQSSGVLYYEVAIVKSGGLPRIGFALANGMPVVEGPSLIGVGNDAKSWGLDGNCSQKWHNGRKPWPCMWTEGDVVGLAVNVDAGQIAVAKNGNWVNDGGGVVFEDPAIRAGVFPCFSGTDCELRYALTDFQHEHLWKRAAITDIRIPEEATSVPSQAYAWYTAITSVSIAGKVAVIEDHAFYKCTSLTVANMPEGLTYIGAGAFEACSKLKVAKIPENVACIGERAFADCISLTLVIPETVTSIGPFAFEGCHLAPTCLERYLRSQVGHGLHTVGTSVTILPSHMAGYTSKPTTAAPLPPHYRQHHQTANNAWEGCAFRPDTTRRSHD